MSLFVDFINNLQEAFAPMFCHKKIQIQTVIREKLRKSLLYKNVSCENLMKWTPDVLTNPAKKEF